MTLRECSAAETSEPPRVSLERVLVVSPHLDDAVLSCGHLLAAARESLVVTVFGGSPIRYPDPPTSWDSACGFRAGDDVVARRQQENEHALDHLGSMARSLCFLDAQYRTNNVAASDIASALRRVFEDWRPSTVVVPLGLRHDDHQLVSAATLGLRSWNDDRTWIGYAEFPYVWRFPDIAARRLARLRRMGLRLTPVLGIPYAPQAKATSLSCYGSQLAGLDLAGQVDRVAGAPELLWLLADRPQFPLSAIRRVQYQIRKSSRRLPIPWSGPS